MTKNTKNIHTIKIQQPGFAYHEIEISLLNPAQQVLRLRKGSAQCIKLADLEHLMGKTTDCQLYVRGLDDLDAWPVTHAYFSKGQFLCAAGKYILGPGYVPLDGEHMVDVCDFKSYIQSYFTSSVNNITFERFAEFIRNSKIPKKFKTAVSDLIYK